jgi:hypothetical protein
MAHRCGSSKDDLATLHARWLQACARRGIVLPPDRLREPKRLLARLRSKDIVTVPQLLRRFDALSRKLQQNVAYDLVIHYDIHQAWPLLIDQLADPSHRAAYADALSRFETGGRATAYFVEVGRRELASSTPDRTWLEAVILGIAVANDRNAAELLVEIFERPDLPGWVRGDAGDKLGICALIRDRRTALFRRCRAAVLRGLSDASIDVQFWSMYVIGSLAVDYGPKPRTRASDFHVALPKLRQIAKRDRRLAPGYWWPMCGEAADVIHCIVEGRWPDPEAAERFPSRGQRGSSPRD